MNTVLFVNATIVFFLKTFSSLKCGSVICSVILAALFKEKCMHYHFMALGKHIFCLNIFYIFMEFPSHCYEL